MNAKSVSVWSTDTFIHARVYGKGCPLLLLHGNGEDHRILEHQIRFFASERQVIAMDTRGHGRSGMGTVPLSFQQIALDSLRLLDFLEVEAVQIIGFSDGGNIALYLASHYPERVKELIVVGANVEPEGMRPDVWYEAIRTYRLQKAMGTVWERFRHKAAVTNLMLGALDLEREDLTRIQQPVLVVAGENDMILETHTSQLARILPRGRQYIVPGATHFLMMENPKEFNRLAADFFEETKKEQT